MTTYLARSARDRLNEARRHCPDRPSWTCAADGTPWPCAAARAVLAAAYSDPIALAVHLTRLMSVAAVEQGLGNPTVLYRRFVRWALGPDAICPACGSRRHVPLPGVPPRLIPCDHLHGTGTSTGRHTG